METNQGYRIMERFPVGEQGFVLGHNPNAPNPYVTWQYRTDAPGHYFWGHYHNEKEAAYIDYHSRIDNEISTLSELTGKPPLLPEYCLTLYPDGELVSIRRGEHGFLGSSWNRVNDPGRNRRTAEYMNTRWGVSKAQEAAMLAGSMFGWDCPAANPRMYDAKGNMCISGKNRDTQEMER